MGYTRERLKEIFHKTDGRCHLCHNQLSFSQYGQSSNTGWEVEHSVPKSKGGTDTLKNLYPAHISCNRSKGNKPTKTTRLEYGQTRAPYSKEEKNNIRQSNTTAGAVIGGVVGLFLGPVGAIVGAAIGGAIGSSNSPKS